MSDPHAKPALFPGTFDPITNGHVDVIRRGRALFGRLIVAIGRNPEKSQLFSLDERREMIRRVLDEQGVDAEVATYRGLTVDFARECGAAAILRGIRNFSDLQFEFQLALTNRAVADVETVFIIPSQEYGFASSSLIRQAAAAGDLDRLAPLLPPLVIEELKKKKANHAFDGFADDALTKN